ncbi:MAG: methionyl-tRNA formyltransferase [Neisseriaceae bacterium]|nr:methionyl-tRNA formyltransferase [Neisseriaceae bacterium]
MKVIFAGTPPFAATALTAIAKQHEVVCVLTQPDRPAGRGMRLKPSAVKETALKLNLPIRQPETLKHSDIQAALSSYHADVMVVAAYGLLLPKAVLAMPKYGCLNIHASLLPRWRGAAPIQRAIEAGDKQTGICIMQMDEGLDTGDVLHRSVIAIDDTDTAATLHDKLMFQGAKDIVAVLQQLPNVKPQPQPTGGISYAKKIGKDEAFIDWKQSAQHIDRQIRAFNPFPVAKTLYQGGVLKIFSGSLKDENTDQSAGTIVSVDKNAIAVATGDGKIIQIHELQTAGSRKMTVAEFLNGSPIAVGSRLGE